MAGHFRLGDLTLKAEWKWNCKQMGDAAAFYHSVESACDYLDALGVKMDKYSLSSGQPAVSFKAATVAEVMLDQFVLTVKKSVKVNQRMGLESSDHPCGAQIMGAFPEDFPRWKNDRS